jgi:hypothetical protein
MPDFSKAWPLATTIASAVIVVAGLVQTGFSIAKSRYELRKLRVEDEKYRSTIARQKTRREGVKLSYERSDYYYERLDYDLGRLARWIVMIVFLALSCLSYLYLTRELYKNHIAIQVKKAELVVLKRANASLGDGLSLLRTLRDRPQKRKEGDKYG